MSPNPGPGTGPTILSLSFSLSLSLYFVFVCVFVIVIRVPQTLVSGIPMETSDQASSMSPKPGPGTGPTIGLAGGMFFMLSVKRIHMMHCQCHRRSTLLVGKIEKGFDALAGWFFTLNDIRLKVISGNQSKPSSRNFHNHLSDRILYAKEKCEYVLECWIKPSIKQLATSKCSLCCSVS